MLIESACSFTIDNIEITKSFSLFSFSTQTVRFAAWNEILKLLIFFTDALK